MKVAELFAAIGFQVDYKQLEAFNDRLVKTQKVVTNLTNGIENVAAKVRNVGLTLTASVTAPLTALAVSSTNAFGKIEGLGIFYETLIGNAKEAKGLMADLLDFEAKTPFTLDQVLTYSQKLLMMKIPLKEIPDMLRMIGEASGGMTEYIGGVLEQLFQVKNLGYATYQDIRPLSNQGVPIIEALAKVLNIETGAVMEAVSNRGVSYEILMQAIAHVAKGREGLLEKRSQSYEGRLAKLTSQWFLFRSQIGGFIVEALHLKEVLTLISDGLDVVGRMFKTLPKWVQHTTVWFAALVALTGPVLVFIGVVTGLALSVGGLSLALNHLNISLLVIGKTLAGVLIVATKIVAVFAFLVFLFEDFYAWLDGADSMLGVLLSPFEEWYKQLCYFIDDIKARLKNLWRAFKNPFDKKNWSDVWEDTVFDVKVLKNLVAPEWEPNDYQELLNVAGVQARDRQNISSITQNVRPVFNFTVPTGTTQAEAKYIRDVVIDTMETINNRQLNALAVGSGE